MVMMAVLLVGILLAGSTGCVSKQKYEALKTEKQALSDDVTRLTQQNQDLEKQVAALKAKELRNPTYAELISFLQNDGTDKNTYPSQYSAAYFARDLYKNARDAGFKAGLAILILKERTFYLIVFETTDRGRLYVEPQKDKIVSLKIGQGYFTQNGWFKPPFDDTIMEVFDWPL
jgi:outer membrane murein-binding lipoprotein Lpp